MLRLSSIVVHFINNVLLSRYYFNAKIKQQIVLIIVDRKRTFITLSEKKCLKNINQFYEKSGICDNEQNINQLLNYEFFTP